MKRGAMYKKGTMGRLMKMLFQFYPVALPLVLLCIIFIAAVSSIPSIFMRNTIAVIEQNQGGDCAHIGPQIIRLILILAGLYIVSLVSSFVYNREWRSLRRARLKNV